MCLLLLAHRIVPGRPWLLLGNRDEFHARATADAAPWIDNPDIIGGRDLVARGSWMAVHRDGRFAAVTNVRKPGAARAARSRGDLVAQFVAGAEAAGVYVNRLAADVDRFGPFNLFVGDKDEAWGLSSVDAQPWRCAPGVHVLSNGAPSVQWPKMRRLGSFFSTVLRRQLSTVQQKQQVEFGANATSDRDIVEESRVANVDASVSTARPVSTDDALLDLLFDTHLAEDAELPDTGVGIDLERTLAPIFIHGATYGTRASTLAYTCENGGGVLIERRFGPLAARLGESRIAF